MQCSASPGLLQQEWELAAMDSQSMQQRNWTADHVGGDCVVCWASNRVEAV